MSYKCSVCGVNEVEHYGDVCELCAIVQDPYAINATIENDYKDTSKISVMNDNHSPKKGSSRKILLDGANRSTNLDPYGNDMTPAPTESSVPVYPSGQAPQTVLKTTNTTSQQNIASSKVKQPLTSGITKNISVDDQKKSVLSRWGRSLIKRVPFTLDNDVTMFQVFPDFTGAAINPSGNACDQVIMYGKINAGVISENNTVEVYGHRDSNNNIIATSIKNVASGTTVKPNKCINAGIVWAVTALIIALMAAFIITAGIEGVIWAVVFFICITNLPLVFKIVAGIFGLFISIVRRVI